MLLGAALVLVGGSVLFYAVTRRNPLTEIRTAFGEGTAKPSKPSGSTGGTP